MRLYYIKDKMLGVPESGHLVRLWKCLGNVTAIIIIIMSCLWQSWKCGEGRVMTLRDTINSFIMIPLVSIALFYDVAGSRCCWDGRDQCHSVILNMESEPSLVKYIVFIMRIFAYTTHRIQTPALMPQHHYCHKLPIISSSEFALWFRFQEITSC